MKRILTIAVAFLLVCSVQASAQARWGVIAGMNFNTSKFTEIDVKARAGWNVGATCLLDLPLGFSVQPSLLYSQKGANITNHMAQNMGYLELPVSVQWGPDLLLFRPFVDVSPFIGYAIANKTFTKGAEDKSWFGKERFEYGIGVGAGVNVWKLQVLARYCWNFGSLYNLNLKDDFGGAIKDHLSQMKADNKNFGGVTISIAYLF